VESLKGILTKMRGQIKSAKEAEEKAKSDMVTLQKQVESLNQAASKLQETPAPSTAVPEKKDATTPPATSQAEKAVQEVAPSLQATQAQPDPKAKKGKKRKGNPQKNASATTPGDPPLKKKPTAPAETTAPQSEGESAQAPAPAIPTSEAGSKSTSDDQNEKAQATILSTEASTTATTEDKAQEKKAAAKEDQAKPTETKEVEVSETKGAPPTATDSKSTPQPKKAIPPKKMIKLTKASQAQTTDTAEKEEGEMKKKVRLPMYCSCCDFHLMSSHLFAVTIRYCYSRKQVKLENRSLSKKLLLPRLPKRMPSQQVLQQGTRKKK
jgi:hypothetical protein